jgi:hypothetical protein
MQVHEGIRIIKMVPFNLLPLFKINLSHLHAQKKKKKTSVFEMEMRDETENCSC